MWFNQTVLFFPITLEVLLFFFGTRHKVWSHDWEMSQIMSWHYQNKPGLQPGPRCHQHKSLDSAHSTGHFLNLSNFFELLPATSQYVRRVVKEVCHVKLKHHNKKGAVDKPRTVCGSSLGSRARHKKKKKKAAPEYLPQKIHINKGDKYWITFSQWHKSSGAAGFEAACGVVRHFKRCGVAPFEGMVNRGVRRALAHTGLREVTSPFFSPHPPAVHLDWAFQTQMRPSVCVLRLSGFIGRHLYLASDLPPPSPIVVLTVSGATRAWDHGYLAGQFLIAADAARCTAASRERSRCLRASSHL